MWGVINRKYGIFRNHEYSPIFLLNFECRKISI
nr:MAG TPA: hypothetical protein [Caudoviricetes sp.]